MKGIIKKINIMSSKAMSRYDKDEKDRVKKEEKERRKDKAEQSRFQNAFERKLEKIETRPVSAFDLRYIKQQWRFNPLLCNRFGISIEEKMPEQKVECFEKGIGIGVFDILPLSFVFSVHAVYIAFRVDNAGQKNKSISWVKEDIEKSKIFLVDQHGGHYFPIETTLKGILPASTSRYGIIAFTPMACKNFSININISKKLYGRVCVEVCGDSKVQEPYKDIHTKFLQGLATCRLERELLSVKAAKKRRNMVLFKWGTVIFGAIQVLIKFLFF